MKVGYGSETSEGTAFVRRVEVTRRSKAHLAKKVIAAVGIAAFVGCGYVAFQSQAPTSHAALRAGTQAAEAATILEVDASATRIMQTLLSGAKFQLRVPGKDNLCVDDGGGMTSGQTKVHLWTCVDNHINQVFVYDPNTNQIRSAGKKNICIDDGGSEYAGHAKFHMFECDPRNINQKFVYDPSTMMFRNPTKNNLCMDDGGATSSGQTQFQLWDCDANNPNQRFALQPIDQLNWRVEHPILLSSEEFMMRVPGKDNLCVDDGGGVASAQTQFHLWTCDPNNLNQVFRYDPATFTIRSSTKANLCVDDGGGLSAGQTKFHLYECNPSNNNQKFVYDWASQMFRNPTKANMCMDDGGGVSSGQTKFHLWDCDVSNGNQHFELIRHSIPDTPAIPTESPTVEPTFEPTIEPTVEPTTEPTVLPTFKPSEDVTDGDWNLLAPSYNTLPSVNADGSVEVTAQEIFDFLLGIKDNAEIKYQSTMYKYRRTMKCVSDGLQTLAKTSVTLDEYHELVMWMYEHCNPDGPNPQPPPPPTSVPVVTSGSGSKSHDPLNPGSSSPPERMYMTKLEFYYKIKEYFMKEEDMMLAGAEAERLHSDMAVAQQKKLIACIEEASNRYGRYMEYELVEHFKNAIKWVQEECVTAV